MIDPAVFDITILQGSEWELPFCWLLADNTPVDLLGCTAAMQIRKSADGGAVYANLTTENGMITGSARGPLLSDGIMLFTMTNLQTADLIPGRYVYDAEVTIGTAVYRIIMGKARVSAEVTR